MSASSSSSSAKLILRQLPDSWLTFIVFFSAIICSALIQFFYEAAHPLPTDDPLPTYASFAVAQRPIYWAEFGRDNQLITERKSAPGISTKLQGFYLGQRWPRDVYWHAVSRSKGKIELTFPPQSISHVAVYLLDGDSTIRVTQISSKESFQVAAGFHNGRWLTIPISDADRKRGTTEITLTKLYGSDVALAGLVAYVE